MPADPALLVFEDEFEGPAGSSPDPSRWNYDIGGWGWGNNELQYYTDRPENVALNGEGHLVITARREDYEGNRYTSARIKTEGLFAHDYGRFEARIRPPSGRAIWPAFWMLGEQFGEIGWPQSGEVDILEIRGSAPGEVHGTVHGPGYSGGASLGGTGGDPQGNLSSEFHTFAVEKSPGEIRWYLDDVLFHSLIESELPEGSEWVFDQPFFFIMNVAVGGWFVLPEDETTPSEVRMLVDYVRVYDAG